MDGREMGLRAPGQPPLQHWRLSRRSYDEPQIQGTGGGMEGARCDPDAAAVVRAWHSGGGSAEDETGVV